MVTHAVHSRFGKDSLRMTNLLHALSAISAMLSTNFHSRDIVSEIISMRSSESRDVQEKIRECIKEDVFDSGLKK